MKSQFYSERQVRSVERIGEVMLPGFENLGCVSEIDRVIGPMPPGDRKDLGLLLAVLSLFPRFVLSALLTLLEKSTAMRGPVAPILRLIRLGLRGVIFSLYYGHPQIHERLGYHVGVYLGDVHPKA